MHKENHNLHGTGSIPCEVYIVPVINPENYWFNVTDIPCPVKGCKQTVLWYEAGYVPGYRVCMEQTGENSYNSSFIKHRFLAAGSVDNPTLIRDHEAEEIYGNN